MMRFLPFIAVALLTVSAAHAQLPVGDNGLTGGISNAPVDTSTVDVSNNPLLKGPAAGQDLNGNVGTATTTFTGNTGGDLVTSAALTAGTGGPVAMTLNLFASIYQAINDPLDTASQASTTALLNYVNQSIKIFASIAVIVTMLGAVLADRFGAGAAGLLTARSVFRAFIIVSLLASIGVFNLWVVGPLLQLPIDIGNALFGGFGAGTMITGGQPFDRLFLHTLDGDFNAATKIGFGFTELAQLLVVLLSAAASALLIGFMFINYLVSTIIYKLVIILAPLFVATLIFKPTRHIFSGWLGALVSALVALVLIQTMLAVLINVQQQIVDLVMNAPANADLWGLVGSAMGLLVLFAVGFLMTLKIDAYAVGIAGGIAQNSEFISSTIIGAAAAAAATVGGMVSAAGAAVEAAETSAAITALAGDSVDAAMGTEAGDDGAAPVAAGDD